MLGVELAAHKTTSESVCGDPFVVLPDELTGAEKFWSGQAPARLSPAPCV
jgi:hypothetical protein